MGQGEKGQAHRWRFFRAGGFDQVRLDTGADLVHLPELDQKLWVALACPTRGLEFDERTLALIDTDGDGRIRPPELLAAVAWAAGRLKNPDDLTRGAAALPLTAIDEGNPGGREVLLSARQVLADLGKADATEITLEDVADTARIFAQTRFNGDGVVPPDAAEDEDTRLALTQVGECLGTEPDRSGKPGVTRARVDQFFLEAQAFASWWEAAEGAPAVLPLGDGTAAAHGAVEAVRAKVEDYFTRCRVAAFDPRAAGLLNRSEAEYAALAAQVLSPSTEEVAALPLARVEAGRPLPLAEGVNPAWASAVARFRADAVTPLMGERDGLTAEEWALLDGRLAPYRAWLAAKAGGAVESLGLPRVRVLLGGPARGRIEALIAQDELLRPQAEAIAAVERLVRYHRDLHRLLNNTVSFRDFYARRELAAFQAGTLYLDGRSCELCVRVADAAKHAALAGLSKTYLAYCDCTRRGGGGDKLTIAAAFTGGDADFLMVGRNGLFYDRQGQDWDATIVKLVEHPISIRQAFWSPYKRIVRMIGEQAEKFAASRDKAVQDQAAAATTAAGQGAEAAKAALPPAFDLGKFVGIFAAIGLALGAIGTALAAVLTGFLGLTWWQMPLAVAGALLAVSGPSMLLAALKLRQRNLGPILDANGWAVNARAMINIPFGGTLTRVAALPPGAERAHTDPYAERRTPWGWYLALLVVLGAVAWAWYRGLLLSPFGG